MHVGGRCFGQERLRDINQRMVMNKPGFIHVATSVVYRRHTQRCIRQHRVHFNISMKANRNPIQTIRDAQTVYSKNKPPWCQPWTIVATGAGAIYGTGSLLHGPAVLLTIPVSAGVLIWWWLFLVLYPRSVLDDENNGSSTA